MAKIPKTFRLSEQAVKNLEQIVDQTGSSDTAIVEIALAHFAKVMPGQVKVNPVPTVQNSELRNLALEMGAPVEQKTVVPNGSASVRGDKKKYRHH